MEWWDKFEQKHKQRRRAMCVISFIWETAVPRHVNEVGLRHSRVTTHQSPAVVLSMTVPRDT